MPTEILMRDTPYRELVLPTEIHSQRLIYRIQGVLDADAIGGKFNTPYPSYRTHTGPPSQRSYTTDGNEIHRVAQLYHIEWACPRLETSTWWC